MLMSNNPSELPVFATADNPEAQGQVPHEPWFLFNSDTGEMSPTAHYPFQHLGRRKGAWYLLNGTTYVFITDTGHPRQAGLQYYRIDRHSDLIYPTGAHPGEDHSRPHFTFDQKAKPPSVEEFLARLRGKPKRWHF
jgi:hypothetical protein